ncbi:addiction module protein [Pandoraea iniqua]|uniref:type II toxin-antitoxin system RelE/ParE family toxin n=1 Tax=Pandoraea iniqua TaxID=2508288 RepID=UPI001241BAC4|nr:type II toxin-antitoxin system RelE/ParE family toxin [Pandoraea iniqua]VVE18217.1 addiction module protein [Pandoraea iniqua]
MYVVNQTKEFRAWLGKLKDITARAKILLRIKRAEVGNFGDSKSLGGGLWEMRVDYGPGYRVYYGKDGEVTYLLVCGGSKSTQRGDIERARTLWSRWNKESTR